MGSQRDCTWILDVPGFQVTTITGEGREAQRRLRVHVDRRGASVIKCCYAATGMYMMAADAVLRESANASTSLSHETTRRRNTKMSRRVSRRVA